jgi:hypothetical protein
MKRLSWLSAMVLLLAAIGPAQESSSPPSKSPAGTKLDENGLVVLQSDDKTKKVQTSSGGTRKKLSDADLSGFDLSDDKSKKVITNSGATRGTEIPSAILLAPRIGKLYGASALFQWAPIGPTDGYIFTIVDDDETRLVRQESKDPVYKLSGLGKLKAGEVYHWKVQALPRTVPGEPLDFKVVSAIERLKIDKELAAIPAGDPYDAGLARARVFVQHKLWFDAIGAYTDLIEKFPDRAQPYEDRGALYSKIDVTHKRGEGDLAKAATLK